MNIRRLLKNGKMCTVIAGVAAMLLAPAQADAVKAYPHPIVKVQPDGSEITIRMMGDEYSHYIIADDGAMLTEENGAYYYALPDGSRSTMLAQDALLRSPEAVKLLDGVDREVMISDVKKRSANSRRSRKSDLRRITPQRPGNPIPGLFDHAFPTTGKQHSLVILVEYADVYFRDTKAGEYFTNMLNQPGFSENGCSKSARDFYLEASTGQFDVTFDVYGPIRLSHNRSYYGGNNRWGDDERPEEMVIEACRAIDGQVDFTIYDHNDDGKIDNVFVFYAGEGEATGGPSSSVWPHSWDVSAVQTVRLDNKLLATYGCSNELVPHENSRNQLYLDAIGTFCHEFGHVMGLPDLYSTDYSSAHDPDAWSIMASGSYNNDGCTPPTFSSFERAALGWLTPEEFPKSGEIKLNPLTRENKAYIVPTESKNEFFLMEMRALDGWDEYLPGNGLLVWHIDYDKKIWDENTCNNDPDHMRVDIVEAHDSELSAFRPFDAFPGLTETMDFGPDTAPALRSWGNADLGVRLAGIELDPEEGMYVTFSVTNEHGEDNQGQDPNNPSSSINSAEANVNYVISGRVITAFVPTVVADVQGRVVSRLDAGESADIAEAGVYIIKSSNRAEKKIIF